MTSQTNYNPVFFVLSMLFGFSVFANLSGILVGNHFIWSLAVAYQVSFALFMLTELYMNWQIPKRKIEVIEELKLFAIVFVGTFILVAFWGVIVMLFSGLQGAWR